MWIIGVIDPSSADCRTARTSLAFDERPAAFLAAPTLFPPRAFVVDALFRGELTFALPALPPPALPFPAMIPPHPAQTALMARAHEIVPISTDLRSLTPFGQ